jgi:S1-C subfamily serine protease
MVENLSDKNDKSSSNETISFDKLGFTVEPLTKEVMNRYEVKNGVFVKNVTRFSHASDRGLRTGLVILKADREDIRTTGQLQKIIESKKKDETILLNLRSSQGNNFMVVLEVQ